MSSDRLNILILHRLDDPRELRHFLTTHVFVLKKFAPNHNYIYHNIFLDFPSYLKNIKFHAVILDVTFLCIRFLPAAMREKIMQKYSFIADYDAVKIALPQDEYDHHIVLDKWMCDLKVDVLYSVCPNDWDILYPEFSKKGKIKLGYTGYIDDDIIGQFNPKDFNERAIDVGYRGRKLPYYFGRIGEMKSRIGELFLNNFSDKKLRFDISTDPKDTIYGDRWLDFIGSCKFVLGSNSGSSLLDPHGDIGKCVKTYCDEHPTASFEEVESKCFPGLDGYRSFTALSPRLLEAALTKTGQILVEGPYSGAVKPWEHYIPLNANLSNKEEVLEAIHDSKHCKVMIENCYAQIVESSKFRYSERAKEIISEIMSELTTKNLNVTDNNTMTKLTAKHDIASRRAEQMFWKFLRLKYSCINFSRTRFPVTYNFLRSVYRGVRY